MEFVRQDGTIRLFLLTTDQALFPEVGAWPDDNIESADVIAKILGETYGGTKTVTPQTDVGLHLITLDCTGVASGSVIELSGEYFIDSVRYAWSEQVFVDPSVAIQSIAEADQLFVSTGSYYELAVYERGTDIEILPRKRIKQLGGTDMTSPATQALGGFQEP